MHGLCLHSTMALFLTIPLVALLQVKEKKSAHAALVKERLMLEKNMGKKRNEADKKVPIQPIPPGYHTGVLFRIPTTKLHSSGLHSACIAFHVESWQHEPPHFSPHINSGFGTMQDAPHDHISISHVPSNTATMQHFISTTLRGL